MLPRGPRRPFSGPPEEHETARVRFAQRFFSAVIDVADLSRAQVGAAVGVSAKVVQRWCGLDDRNTSPPYHAILAMPKKVRKPMAEGLLDGTGCAVVELPAAADAATDLSCASKVMTEVADVLQAHSEALRDGHICAREGRVIEDECTEAIAALLTVRERARQAQREGVIGTTGRRAVGEAS